MRDTARPWHTGAAPVPAAERHPIPFRRPWPGDTLGNV